MKAFLKQVAEHYFAEGSLERKCFIFPNKRSIAFFRKYLCGMAAASGTTSVAPQMYAMNDFFLKIAGKRSTDKVHLLLKLYESYKRLNPSSEPLDDFIFWGDVILEDFDDVDKYLVDASGIFTNVAQFKDMKDNFSYLSPTQREAIERLLSHFEGGGAIKNEFRKIWDILLPLYNDFRSSIEKEGLSYEGQVYRSIAERLKGEAALDILSAGFHGTEKFIFVGLNALNECEKTLMRKCRDAGIADFCWDYSGRMTTDPDNKSSFFLSGFVKDFPQAFEFEDEDSVPEFRAISVPSASGQAKQLPALLDEISSEGSVPGLETAIIIPDEKMLVPVLNSIPENIRQLNVTMGYPLSGSSLWSLMNDIAAMQLHIKEKDGQQFFYHRQVWSIFSNSLFKSVISEEERERICDIRSKAQYYIPFPELSGTPLFDLIFRSAGSEAHAIGQYQREIVAGLAARIRSNGNLALELDFAKDLYLAIGRLISYDLPVRPETYYRLLGKIVAGTAVPFKGEPLNGLQIMGPLETRALDFENIIILNCNEGVFPHHTVSSSFIPPELRKAFGLPTYEYQDVVWAYYFYRMTRRAKKVTMLYDSRTEATKSGEESRYIKQLELHFKVPVKHYTVKSPIIRNAESDSIEKTEEHIATLRSGHLSASALQNYLCCQAKFYYGSVCGLNEKEDVNEFLDAGTLGTVFHESMRELYSHREYITAPYIKELLSNPDRIRDCVRRFIMKQLHCFEITGRNLIFEDIVARYVSRVLSSDLELMKNRGVPSFRILGLEKSCHKEIGGFNFVGFIDRMDCFSPGEVRIVDYKTGKVTDDDFIITEDNAETVVGALFGTDDSKRPKIALQLYLYDMFAKDMKEVKGRNIVNSIYQTSRLFTKDVENVELNDRFCGLMEERINDMLLEITDTKQPWTRTADTKSCEFCNFKNICGR